MADIEQSVAEWLLIVGHVWPGITAHNVWTLTYADWCMYAEGARRWHEARTREADQARGR